MFYVYSYCYPNTDVPFYIGKGTGRRSSFHLTAAAGGYLKNKLLEHTIKKYGADVKIIAEFQDEGKAYDEEERLITFYGRRLFEGGPLCNMTAGGRGVSGHVHTDEARQKMSASKTGKKIQRSAEHNAKIKAAHKARWDKLIADGHQTVRATRR